MVWTVLALALWVVLGGFISYYGDLQGRRWGKRRVSWFGLRPKHTAILITSLTGGFIALFSVASLMIIVPTVRDVVTHGENAIQENKRLIADEKRQQGADRLERERVDLESKQKQLANDKLLADGRQKLAELQSQFRNAQARLAPLQARLETLRARTELMEARQEKLVGRNKDLEKQNATAGLINSQLGRQNVDLSHENGVLEKTDKALLAASKTLEQKNARLIQIGRQQTESNNQLYGYNVSLVNAKEALEKEKSALDRQVADLTHQREEVIDLIRRRDQVNSQLQDLNSRIAEQINVLRQGYVILRAGVELGRISMDAHLRPEAIKNQVDSLIASASDQAKRFGAESGENGQAAALPQMQKPSLTGYDSIDQTTQLDSLANEWAGSDTPYVVVATTVSNCLAGEPAYIRLHRYPVVRVFAKGAEVASRTIDGHSKVDDIINNLMAFLQKDVQKSAIQAGIIPRVDPETGMSEVGVLGTADLFRLTDTVRRMRGPVVLTARAKQDVSSADRLNLTFHVSRLPSQPQTVATD